MAENIDDQCRVFHIFLGGNASKSALVKQAFENAKEEQLKDYKQKTSKDDFAFILTRMLVFFSKSHRKGLGKHGKNFKTKFR
ncbi:hypothetical protein BTM449_02160 [Helicobacter pylori]